MARTPARTRQRKPKTPSRPPMPPDSEATPPMSISTALRSLMQAGLSIDELCTKLQELAAKDVETPDADRDVKLRQLEDYAAKGRRLAFESGCYMLQLQLAGGHDPLAALAEVKRSVAEGEQREPAVATAGV